MSYESGGFGFGAEQGAAPIESAGGGVSPVPMVTAGIGALIGGAVLFALAIPFVVGAVSGAVVAPSGSRKQGAKSGALAGGLGWIIAYPVVYGITGNSRFSKRVTAAAPLALGGYMGYRLREEEE